RRLRPRSHYSMGWLPVLLAAGRLVPKLANRFLGSPVLRVLARRLGGIDPNRELPALAEDSFRRWFRHRPTAQDGDPVLLWTDCFTSSFSPQAAQAAVQLLEKAGYRVRLAPKGACCGLTWVST